MTKVHVHFLGIGGSGASAAAAVAQAQGFEVTGCDLEPNNEFTTEFKPSQLLKGHSASHLSGVNVIAITPAILSLDPDNEELLEAKKHGIEILTWQEFLGKYLTKDEQSSSASQSKFVIAITGTHGKTTTTAMIAKMLEDANLDPTVVIGAIVPSWKANYRVGQGKFFVIEADEFNDNFLSLTPDISVITNIEMDHPEYFKNFASYKQSFKKFLLKTKETIVANIADSGVAEVLKVAMKETGVTCLDYSKNEIDLELKIPGEFNKQNANAAFQVGLLLNIDPIIIKKSLSSYPGIGRRFELLGEFKGATIYTDFGHHPTEIKTTMEAAREKFPDQHIWLIYQPHMFSRTKGLFKEFVETFNNLPVNQTLIMDIYPSREVDTGLVSSQELVEAIDKSSVDYVASVKELTEILKSEITQGDIVFFMGAGDIDKIARGLLF